MIKRFVSIVLSCFLLVITTNSFSQVKLPRLVRDSMILQRDMKVKIWGWASKGERVSVKFNGKSYKTKTNANGDWSLLLPPMKAGGPYTMDISGKNKITLNDILIGDVWLCTGQSNMVHQMILHGVRYAEDIATANYPEIRHFWIPTMATVQGPRNDLPTGFWKSANPEDVKDFSAIAYFFARKLYQKYHVPIGLINASVGGTPIEAWMSEEGFKEFPDIKSTIARNRDTTNRNSRNGKSRCGRSSSASNVLKIWA